MTTDATPNTDPQAVIDEFGLTMTAKFVPFSETDEGKDKPGTKSPSLNWIVTIRRNGKDVITSPYMAGCAHAPSYQQRTGTNVWIECENGHNATNGAKILPKLADVLHCLVSDAEAIDCPTFEEWAGDYDYDPDSRKAEKTYRACLEIGFKLRAALGEDGLTRLREAFQDY